MKNYWLVGFLAGWILACSNLPVGCLDSNPCGNNEICVAGQCIDGNFSYYLNLYFQNNPIGSSSGSSSTGSSSTGTGTGSGSSISVPTFDYNTFSDTNVACIANNTTVPFGPGYCFNPSDPNFAFCAMSIGNTPDPGCPGASCQTNLNCNNAYVCNKQKLCTFANTSALPVAAQVTNGNQCESLAEPGLVVNFSPVPSSATLAIVENGNILGSVACTNTSLPPQNCAHVVALWQTTGNYTISITASGYAPQTVNANLQQLPCQATCQQIDVDLKAN